MKKAFILIIISFIIFPHLVSAQETTEEVITAGDESPATRDLENNSEINRVGEDLSSPTSEEIFEAKVIEIIEEKEVTQEDGTKYTQQNVKLKGLNGKWKDKEVTFYGISDIEVAAKNIYKKGNKVLVAYTKDVEGNEVYYIVDYVRRGSLYFLAILFALVIVIIGKFKGFRALVALTISFIIIMKFIIPKILEGSNPLFIAIFGSLFILFCIVYLTEGFNKKSHLAVVSILISLLLTGILSIIFTAVTKLTGLAQEETLYLISSGQSFINLKGLLLAAIIIGALGVLDDVVISQISSVEQIKKANPGLNKKEVYKRAFQIGKSHLGSMVNTLFLAYAGAALPLLLLFNIKEPPFLTFNQVLNNEVIATEIVRTLTGSIGLALAVPIATLIGAYYLKAKE